MIRERRGKLPHQAGNACPAIDFLATAADALRYSGIKLIRSALAVPVASQTPPVL
jgi:hypothetical protein